MSDERELLAAYRRATSDFLTARPGADEERARKRFERAWRAWNEARERRDDGAAAAVVAEILLLGLVGVGAIVGFVVAEDFEGRAEVAHAEEWREFCALKAEECAALGGVENPRKCEPLRAGSRVVAVSCLAVEVPA